MSRTTRRSFSLIALAILLLTGLLPAASWAQEPVGLPADAPAVAPDLTNNISLSFIGRYTGAGAEISAYDPATKRLFVTGPQLQILNIANPVSPTLVTTVAVDATSVAVKNGIVAATIPANPIQDPGQVVFLTPDGAILKSVTVGALPDMLTFTPDGTKVLVANEGEPGATDPEGSVSVIDVSAGVASATVATASLTAFNGKRQELINRGVRIFPSAASVAQDLEPEYIAIAPDGITARVTLQEANAVAVLDIASATITQILPLGLKDHSRGLPRLTTYAWQDRPVLGQAPSALAGTEDAAFAALPDAPAGVQISLGGFSGLFFEGKTPAGTLKFITHTDRGPNGEPTDLISYIPGNERPFPMPKFQPELVRFELNPTTGAFAISERIGLTQPDGVKMTGLPNLQAGAQGTAYTDEIPIDLFGNQLANRPLGIDPEGIVVAPDGTFWMVEEYRPAILHFDATGKQLARYIPEGTAASAGAPVGTFGTESLPAVFAQRRANRGFEGIALEGNKVYAFIQSALDNPDTANDATSRASRNLRIVEFDTASQTVTAEYLYNLRDISGSGSARTDKIGDATALGNGRFLVIERDDRLGADANKLVQEIDLKGATDIHNPANLAGMPAGKTLEQLSEAELAAAGIRPVFKRLVTNLAALGYTGVSKAEGLAVVDGQTLAVINDNDFGIQAQPIPGDGTLPMNPKPEPVLLGLVRFDGPAGLDASDRDGDGGGKRINIQPWPVLGMYMPDGIAAFSAGGQAFYATANEGDARSDPARSGGLNLDPAAFPNAADLKNNAMLGRLNASTIDGDVDGDGDYDRLYAYGARSFSIWDAAGNLVSDSGDAFERITAGQTPTLFNANDGAPAKWDERSDDKGPEPEGIAIGTLAGRPYAFIGLERAGGGVMVYDVGNPRQPLFVGYFRTDGDISPEGVLFIPAQDSPTGAPLVVLTHELSNTTSIYEVKLPGTNDAPYVKATAPDVSVKALLTVGETVPLTRDPSKDYRMVGIPDGLGAHKDEHGYVHLFVNHELRNTVASQPIVDGPSVKGAFISHYLLAGDNASVLSGDLAFTHVAVWDGAAWVDRTADWQSGAASFTRFCSGYLAGPHSGFDQWIYLTGEENPQAGTFDGLGGLAVAVLNDTAYALTDMGHFAKENVVVLPGTGDKTVVMLLEDGPSSLDSQLYLYVGAKNPAAADPIQRAGLVGGQLYFFRSTTAGKTDESTFHKADGTIAGEWVNVASVLNAGETVRTISDDNLNASVKAAGAFNVIRVEDAAYDRNTAGVVYFDTTGSSYKHDGTHYTNKLGRIYKLVVNPADPAGSPAQLTVLLEGDAGDPIVNPDNLDTNTQGILMIQEDPNAEHNGAGLLDGLGRDSSIWHYDLATGRLLRVAEVDQSAVASGAATRDSYFLNLLSGKEPATDSASAATAIATGYKTDDGNLAWLPGDPDNGSLTTIAETLRSQKGFAISVVSTVPFSHATPAGFVSHNKSRNNYAAIANEIIFKTQPDVVVAGGNSTYQTGYIAPADQAALKAGQTAYTYVERQTGVDGATSLTTTAAGVSLAAGQKLFGLYGGAGGNVEYYAVADAPGAPAVTRSTIENPTLTDMANATLGVLSQDPDGFFVMFEQGDIDWANHRNHFRNMIGGVWDLDSAVRAAEAFVAQPGGPEWADTLMIVTSDHSNSYMRLPIPLGKGDLPEQVFTDKNGNGKEEDGEWAYPGGEVTYRTTNHTNELVTLWARGQGASLLKQYAGLWHPGTQIVDNSQLYHVMRRAVAEAGARHVMLFIGDGMNIEHEIAGSRYLYGTDNGLAWYGWGSLADGWAGYASTWDVTTYNKYADSLKVAKYSALSFDPVVGYNPGLGGALPFPVQPDSTVPKWPRGSWETSGIIDASAIYGTGSWLLDVQAHTVDSLMASQLQGFATDQKVVEGGQLLLMTVTPRSLPPQANLSVAKSAVPMPAAVGFPLTYTLTVRNGGPDTATGVILSDPLPSDVTFVSATPSQGACAAPRLTCNLDDLPAGGSATVTVVVKPTLAGVTRNHASASTATVDSNPFNNTAMMASVVRPAYRLFLPQISKP